MNQSQTETNETEYKKMEQHVLMMGNNILASLNADEVVTDVQIFQKDIFYIRIFQETIRENLGLQPGQTPAEMAENIDAILNMIEDAIPDDINIETLNGDMIVEGNFLQIVVILELAAELIRIIDEDEEDENEQAKLSKMQASEETINNLNEVEIQGSDYEKKPETGEEIPPS